MKIAMIAQHSEWSFIKMEQIAAGQIHVKVKLLSTMGAISHVWEAHV